MLQECRPRQQIDIWIEHQRQHRRRATQRSDLGEPVVTRAPPGDIAQGGLHDTGMVQHMGIGIGQNVSREGQRQHQRNLQPAHTGKPRHRDQPGRPHTDGKGAGRYDAHKRQRGRGIPPQHRPDQMLHGLRATPKRCNQHRDHRHGADQRHKNGGTAQKALPVTMGA